MILTPAQQRFLISVLFSTQPEVFNSTAWGDKPAGTRRCNMATRRKTVEKLTTAGLITWDHARCYTTREIIDVALTERGYHIAARCLLWRHRDELEAYPRTITRQLTRPLV